MAATRWLAVLVLATPPVFADTSFRAKPMKATLAPLDHGQCDIRLRVDGEAEITVLGDRVSAHTISGGGARDDGSECSQALPVRDVRGFGFAAVTHSGEMQLVAPPSAANGFQAVVRIHNPPAGEGRYHFRLTWAVSLGVTGDANPGPAGFAWNNAARYKSRGAGEAAVGDVRVALLDADVAIDLGGKVWVTFGAPKRERLSFSGVLNARDDGRLRADVVCDGPEWHVQGPMYLSVDETHDRVNSVTLDATDGRDRLHLEWKRR